MKYLERTLATYVYNYCNMGSITIYFCNIHMKHLQHTTKTSETIETYAWNMRFQRNIYLLLRTMKARRRVEFTGGSRDVATVDQINSTYRKARRGALCGHRYPGLYAGHAAPAAGATAPTTTGSLAMQWIWWKEG